MKKTEKRLITLSDGTGMGGELLVIRTDAPAEVLSELEKISCEIFINGANYEDVPIWADVLKEKGYEFTYIDSCTHRIAGEGCALISSRPITTSLGTDVRM